MHAILITMSPKRLAQCQEDPDTLADVVEARLETEIPGLLDLGTAWNALDALLSDGGKDAVLGDAVLARSGEPFDSDFKSARLLTPARVAEIAKKLEALKPATVLGRHHRRRRGARGARGADQARDRALQRRREGEALADGAARLGQRVGLALERDRPAQVEQ